MMFQTHVNNDIYNKYCLIHNTYQIKKLQYVYLWFSSPDRVGVTDEA